MTHNEFKAAMEDMNARMEGEGFSINVSMRNGAQINNVVWSYLGDDMIVLHREDNNPTYTTADMISHVELAG